MNSNSSQLRLKVVRRKHQTATPDPTHEKLLEVAGPIFANRGYQATTIREICVGAGANVAAVNYHFGNKLGLYTEVLQQSVRAAEVLAVQNALDRNTLPEDVLRALIRARLRSINGRDLPDWHSRLLAQELANPTPALRKLIDKVTRPIYKRLLELIGEMIGLPANDDKTRLCAISVVTGSCLRSARSIVDGDLAGTKDETRSSGTHCGSYRGLFTFVSPELSLEEWNGDTGKETEGKK